MNDKNVIRKSFLLLPIDDLFFWRIIQLLTFIWCSIRLLGVIFCLTFLTFHHNEYDCYNQDETQHRPNDDGQQEVHLFQNLFLLRLESIKWEEDKLQDIFNSPESRRRPRDSSHSPAGGCSAPCPQCSLSPRCWCWSCCSRGFPSRRTPLLPGALCAIYQPVNECCKNYHLPGILII